MRPLKFIELTALKVEDCPVVILPGVEGFPVRQFGFVRDYVKRGGTLVIPSAFSEGFAPNGQEASRQSE